MKKSNEKYLIIVNKIYPIIAKAIERNHTKYKQVLNRFFEKRNKELYDTCPCDRIFFGKDDLDDFYKSLNIDVHQITEHLSKTYYYQMPNFNPRAAKDEFTVAVLMIIRYFFLKKNQKEMELATLYLAFSGKFYPSIHSGSFPMVLPSENRYIMDYVVNHKLTNKFDLKTEMTIINAIRSKCRTWLDTYDDKLKNCDDEDVVYLIQQLHNRIKSFMKNIAELYYETYKNKDAYFVYDSDNLSDENYHIADNDSLKIERIVEKTMSNLNGKSIDYNICKMSSDDNVHSDEIKNIIETILSDNSTIPIVKELIRNVVTQYFLESKTKNINDINFVSKSITPRPNSKDKAILRRREIIEKLLTENSTAYLRRKSRYATQSSYQKSLLSFFVLSIYYSNK